MALRKNTRRLGGWGDMVSFLATSAMSRHSYPLGRTKGTTEVNGGRRSAACNLQGHRTGHRTLICPDSLLVVNGS